MTHPTAAHVPPAPDFREMLRQSLAGLSPNDLLASLLDRMEGRA